MVTGLQYKILIVEVYSCVQVPFQNEMGTLYNTCTVFSLTGTTAWQIQKVEH